LNRNCHYLVSVLDGAYICDPAGLLLFRPCPPPSHDAIERVERRVHDRALRRLKRHGYLDERQPEERSIEVRQLSALDGCAQLALRTGSFVVAVRIDDALDTRDPAERICERDGAGVLCEGSN
jgi:hypothetical protein